MKVKLDMKDTTITLGNQGIELAIADEHGKHQGTLRIGQATVEWRKGRIRPGNGKKIKLSALLAMIEAE